MSMFLGDQLTEIFDRIVSGKGGSSKKAGLLGLGTEVLPKLPQHAGDRNRTSPFAFTGNKFEFRAVGSSQSVSFAITVLNLIATESINAMTAMISAKMKKKQSFESALSDVIKDVYKKHARIIFNGDGYSDDWHKEAAKRGLLNLATSVSAIDSLVSAKNTELFSAHGVLTARELEARQEVMFDQYFKSVNIEGETTEWIAQTQILPAVLRYLREVSSITIGSNAIMETCKELTDCTDQLITSLQKLRTQNAELGGNTVHEKSYHMLNNVIPAMNNVRSAADVLERLTAHDHWPLPSYRELLFVK
jgi:glutamine synthetase